MLANASAAWLCMVLAIAWSFMTTTRAVCSVLAFLERMAMMPQLGGCQARFYHLLTPLIAHLGAPMISLTSTCPTCSSLWCGPAGFVRCRHMQVKALAINVCSVHADNLMQCTVLLVFAQALKSHTGAALDAGTVIGMLGRRARYANGNGNDNAALLLASSWHCSCCACRPAALRNLCAYDPRGAVADCCTCNAQVTRLCMTVSIALMHCAHHQCDVPHWPSSHSLWSVAGTVVPLMPFCPSCSSMADRACFGTREHIWKYTAQPVHHW
jgi:hypothetical protein